MRTLLDESSTRHWWESKVIGHGSANACVWLQVFDQNAFAIFVLEMWLSACVCVFLFLWGWVGVSTKSCSNTEWFVNSCVLLRGLHVQFVSGMVGRQQHWPSTRL